MFNIKVENIEHNVCLETLVSPVNGCCQDAGEIEATHSETQTSDEWLKTHSVDTLQLNLKNLMDKSQAVR